MEGRINVIVNFIIWLEIYFVVENHIWIYAILACQWQAFILFDKYINWHIFKGILKGLNNRVMNYCNKKLYDNNQNNYTVVKRLLE